jgi:hypothetical protein
VPGPHRLPHVRIPQTDRPYRWPVVMSFTLQALLIFFLVRQEIVRRLEENDSKAPGLAGQRGGGGGEIRIALDEYQPPAAAKAPAVVTEQPPVPPPVVLPKPDIRMQKVEVPVQTGTVTSTVDMSGLTGQGPGKGGGIGTGVGPGAGADSGKGTGGEGGDVFPPKPQYAIVPPFDNRPASVKGRSFAVHFWINAAGRVTKVQLEPEITDRAYRREFLDRMQQYAFVPAHRLDGTPVASEMTITIEL